MIREEAAFVFSTDREEAVRTRVARIVTWVNMTLTAHTLEDKMVMLVVLVFLDLYTLEEGWEVLMIGNILDTIFEICRW